MAATLATTTATAGRIVRLDRLRNSRAGNPRWRFTLTDGRVLTTAPNIMDAYAVCAPWLGMPADGSPSPVTGFTLDRRGFVVAITPGVTR